MLNFLENRRRTSLILVSAFAIQIAMFVVASNSLAQSTSQSAAGASTSAGGKKEAKRTTINFEDQLIEGRTQKPELFVLLQNRMNNSRRLFKLRENFLPEMRKTAEDVGRAESNARGSAEPAK